MGNKKLKLDNEKLKKGEALLKKFAIEENDIEV